LSPILKFDITPNYSTALVAKKMAQTQSRLFFTTMNELKEILNQNWIGTLIGIVGIVIGVILAYSFKPRSRLAAQTNTLGLLGPNAVLPTEIEFLFRGAKVSNVAMSRIAIWNIGNTTIKGDQMVSSDPLRIVTSKGSSILEVTIRHCTRQVNGVSCVLREGTTNDVECRFDYLDPGDGALIQLIHTGSDDVTVLGTLRGVPKGVLISSVPKKKPEKPEIRGQVTPLAARLIALVVFCFSIVIFIVAATGDVKPPSDLPFVVLFGIAVFVLAIGLFFGSRVLPPSQLSTQITSNEPPKKAWHYFTTYEFQTRTEKEKS
jgi:hypothetical protein